MKQKSYLILFVILGGITITSVYAATTENFQNNWNLFDTANNISRLYVDNSGNLGIGTTTPSQKLDINGNLTLEGVKGTIYNIQGIGGVGAVNTGWYSDGSNLAARIPSSSGGFFVQSSGGSNSLLHFSQSGGGTSSYMDLTGYMHLYGKSNLLV